MGKLEQIKKQLIRAHRMAADALEIWELSSAQEQKERMRTEWESQERNIRGLRAEFERELQEG